LWVGGYWVCYGILAGCLLEFCKYSYVLELKINSFLRMNRSILSVTTEFQAKGNVGDVILHADKFVVVIPKRYCVLRCLY
jgi:hypothetical protein